MHNSIDSKTRNQLMFLAKARNPHVKQMASLNEERALVADIRTQVTETLTAAAAKEDLGLREPFVCSDRSGTELALWPLIRANNICMAHTGELVLVSVNRVSNHAILYNAKGEYVDSFYTLTDYDLIALGTDMLQKLLDSIQLA